MSDTEVRGAGSTLAASLLAAQKEMEAVVKDSTNPHFKSKYADITSVLETVLPTLNRHDIAVLQVPTLPPPGAEGDWLALETILMHESGESIRGTALVPVQKHAPQDYGSAITYARRYALAAMVGLRQEDDDAESATSRGSESAVKPRPQFNLNNLNKAAEPKAPAKGKAPMFPKVAGEGQANESK